MTVKEFLDQYMDCELKITAHQIHIFQMRENVEHIALAFNDTPQMGATANKVLDTYTNMEKDVFYETLRLKKIQKSVAVAIGALTHPKQKAVLERRYLFGMSLSEAAKDMGISYQYAYALHHKALQEIKLPDMAQGIAAPLC